MRRTLLIALVSVCLLSGACRSRTDETSADTDTISPAAGVQSPTTTDAVTTQTVDVADIERSGAEGEGATEPDPTTTATAPPPSTTKTRP